MPTKSKKIETITVALEAQAGSLAKVYSAFKESNVNVIASWAYEMGPGQAQAHFYVSDTTRAAEVLTKMGKKPATEFACWFETEDKMGAYSDILAKISKANINIHATDAFSIGGKFATVFFADQKDISALCKTLGC